jgi:hypothetical protein
MELDLLGLPWVERHPALSAVVSGGYEVLTCRNHVEPWVVHPRIRGKLDTIEVLHIRTLRQCFGYRQ